MILSRGRLQPGLAVLLLIFAIPSSSLAQSRPCAEAVSDAEIAYRNGDFREAESILSNCLDRTPGVADREAVTGYRLLALARLQEGDIAGARIAVVRIIARQRDYSYDPVVDPPGYQALVETVRRQFDDAAFRDEIEALRAPAPAPDQEAERIPGFRRARMLYLTGTTGLNGYGGDRGVTEDSPLSDFVTNAGLLLGVSAGYNVIDYAGVVLQYELGNSPRLNDQKAPVFPVIDRATSSTWIQSLSLQGMVRILPGGVVSPYLRSGPGLAIARINSEWRVGTSVEVTAGLDVAVSPDIGIFADLGARWVFPGEAMDLVAWDHDFDLFTSLRLGLAWRVGRVF